MAKYKHQSKAKSKGSYQCSEIGCDISVYVHKSTGRSKHTSKHRAKSSHK